MLRILIGIAALLAVSACALSSRPAAPPEERTASVVVDPRIELLGVLQLLSDYPLTTPLEHTYKAEGRSYFAPHANHRAVELFREMWRREFRFSEVPTAIYAFTAPPELRSRRALSEATLKSAGGEAKLLELIAAMREFQRISDFDRFFARQQPLYASLVRQTQPAVGRATQRLQHYVGMPLGNTTVVLGPMLHVGGFAATYDADAFSPEVVAFIGPDDVVSGVPSFGSDERLAELVSHEFAHTVINPLAERHRAAIAQSSHLHREIASKMLENGYAKWDQAVYEHIIRAITARLAARDKGEEAGRKAVTEEVQRGFVYVPALVESLRVYEDNRDKYPTLDAYFPQLLSVFAAQPH